MRRKKATRSATDGAKTESAHETDTIGGAPRLPCTTLPPHTLTRPPSGRRPPPLLGLVPRLLRADPAPARCAPRVASSPPCRHHCHVPVAKLFLGAFRCVECEPHQHGAALYLKYTEPLVCPAPTCGNRTKWALLREESTFVDWQRLHMQEAPDEVPPGCLPRARSKSSCAAPRGRLRPPGNPRHVHGRPRGRARRGRHLGPRGAGGGQASSSSSKPNPKTPKKLTLNLLNQIIFQAFTLPSNLETLHSEVSDTKFI